MRLTRERTFVALLALLLVLTVLRRRELPGEEALPGLYRSLVYDPFLDPGPAPAVEPDPELRMEELRVLADSLQRQNRELREKNSALEKLLGLKSELGLGGWAYTPVAARVLSIEPGTYRRFFRISRGAADGVAAGMPVVDGTTLLGIVASSGASTALVRRLDDPQSRIEVEVETQERAFPGVAQGTGDGTLRIRLLRGADAVLEGAAVFTTAYDARVPAGLLVGRVEQVQDLDRDQVLEVVARPTAAFERPVHVEVLLSAEPR